jgi:hypothetical protein
MYQSNARFGNPAADCAPSSFADLAPDGWARVIAAILSSMTMMATWSAGAADHEATLSANPTAYTGTCPGTITFNGTIKSARTGVVQYRFTRSDGALDLVKTLNFSAPGAKPVSTTWTLGDPSLPSFSGWQAIEILYPVSLHSDHANFTLQCAERGIRWAGRVNPSARSQILGAPDGNFTVPPLTVSNFGKAIQYPGLAKLLGISDSELARADVIAFEDNGGSGAGPQGGWESSVWTFSDGRNTYRVHFNETTPVGQMSDPSVVANGFIRGTDGSPLASHAAYVNFFRIPARPVANVISYILFDLHSLRRPIDTSSPRFNITVKNGPIPEPGLDDPKAQYGEGTPDPDSIGIFAR